MAPLELSASAAIGLSVCNLIVWGVWPFLRVQCSLEGPSFTILYFLGQFLAALFLSLALSPSAAAWAAPWLECPADSWRVAVLVFGGGCVGNADFLCSLAMSRVDFAIAFPVYAGLALGLGSTLVYFIDREGNASLLFSGVAFALLAILALAAAEAQPPLGHDDGHGPVSSPLHAEGAELREVKIAAASDDDDGGGGDAKKKKKSKQRWVWVCFFCGLVGSLWCPLSSLGRAATGVTNPLVALCIFQLGQLSSVPLQCCYYSLVLDVVEPHTRLLHDATARDPVVFFLHIARASRRDVLIALGTGSLVGIGFSIFFVTSSSINPTVALAIASCEPLMTIFMGVCVSNNLRLATRTTKALYAATTCCFAAAIALLALAV